MGNALDCCNCRWCFPASEYDSTPAASLLLPQRQRVPPPGAPVAKKWYHRGIDREEAEYRLRSVSSENGVYLVYDNPKSRGSYILLVLINGDCVRLNINRKRDGSYILGEDRPGVKSHETVRKLIKYHRGMFGKPIALQHGGTVKLNDYVYKESGGRSFPA